MLNFKKIAMEKLMFYYEFILAPIAFECVGLFFASIQSTKLGEYAKCALQIACKCFNLQYIQT
jgi:hypothetical protein